MNRRYGGKKYVFLSFHCCVVLFQCLHVALIVLPEICTFPRAQMYEEQNSPLNRVYFSNSDGIKTVNMGGAQTGPFGWPE